MQRRMDHAEEPYHSTMNHKFISVLMILMSFLPVAHSEELGRLFFTPEQRSQLDYGYLHADTAETDDRRVILNGIVQKHGGKRTAWINGVAQEVGPNEHTPEVLPVTVPGKSRPVKIKVGQKVEIEPAESGQ